MKRNPQAGFALLLDLMISALVLMTLFAMSTPFVLGLIQVQNQVSARQRVVSVAQAQAQIAICSMTNGCVPNSATTAIVPAPGSITMSGYVYTFAQNGSSWTFTAAPTNAATAVFSYEIAGDGILHCQANAPNVNAMPVCN